LVDRLNRKAKKADAAWLIEILKARRNIPVSFWDRRDAIAVTVCTRLAETKDLASMDTALGLARGRLAFQLLARGFISPEGRAYLIARLSDPKLSASDRGLYCGALVECMTDYPYSAVEGERFLQQIAGRAVDFAKGGDEQNSAALIEHLRVAADLDEQEVRGSAPIRSSVEPDLVAALNLVKQAYDDMTSTKVKYAIDRALLASRLALGFRAPVGLVTSLVTIPVPGPRSAPFPAGHIVLACSYDSSRSLSGRHLDADFVFEQVETHATFLTPVRTTINAGGQGWFSDSVALPANLAPGRYRIFVRIEAPGDFVSEGHGVEIDLARTK
jgi:hypothetical protein